MSFIIVMSLWKYFC